MGTRLANEIPSK